MTLRAVFALVLLAGCAGGKIVVDDSGKGPHETGLDTDDTGPDTVVSGAIAASPAALDFGVVFVGQTLTLPVTVSNVGDGAVALALTSSGSGAFTIAEVSDPGPGESVDILVTYTPTSPPGDEGTLTIADTLGSGSIDIDLSGSAQVDADGDGVGSIDSGGTDCDDTNASAYPGATEVWYDGIDQDCLGGDDYDRDADGSTYDLDCDESDATVYPGATETWYDGVDSDCAGDDDFDQDADGVDVGADCDDTDATVYPGAADTWYDGIDSDCAGDDDYDQDLDGYDSDVDCDDLDATIHPDATETWYDGIDQDCAGDDDYDQDGDGVDYPTDCNDTDPTVTGPVDETLNGIDDDCDGAVDDVSIGDVYGGVLYGDSSSLGLGDADGLSLGGDLTGDGADDLIVASDSSSSGYAWVVTGATAAAAAGNVSDYDTEAITGASSYYPLGNVVGPAVDVTGDGTEDVLIAGAGSYGSYYSYGYGYAWLETGGAALTGSLSVSSTYAARFSGDSSGDALSWAVGGDLDGDGDNDIVTACPGDNYGSSYYSTDYYAGNIGVFEAGTFSGDYDLEDAADQIAGSNDYDYLGTSLVVADLDGDGYDDVVAGASGLNDGADNAGGVYLFPGNSSLEWSDRADDAAGFRILGNDRDDGLGEDPFTAPGDVDGDGALDLIVPNQDEGEAWLFLSVGGLTGDYDAADADISFSGTAGAFASATAIASDTDGDGAAEIYVGDQGDDTVGTDAGAVFRFDYSGGGAFGTSDASASFYGVATGDYLGSGLAGGGDADGDGVDDLLIGATGVDTGASGGGAVYVLLGD